MTFNNIYAQEQNNDKDFVIKDRSEIK